MARVLCKPPFHMHRKCTEVDRVQSANKNITTVTKGIIVIVRTITVHNNNNKNKKGNLASVQKQALSPCTLKPLRPIR